MLRCEEEFEDVDVQQTMAPSCLQAYPENKSTHAVPPQRDLWPSSNCIDHGLVEVTLGYMLREEHHFHVAPSSWIRSQGVDGIQVWMRPPVIEWMSEVCEHYDLACLQLSVNILDRYLSQAQVLPADLQMHGAASLMIASKIKDDEPPTLSNLCSCADFHFDQDALKATESVILHTLEWRLQSICVDEIFEHFLFLIAANLNESIDTERLRKYGMLFAEMAMLDFDSLHFYPSIIACAALINSIELIYTHDCGVLPIIQRLGDEASVLLNMDLLAQCKTRMLAAFREIIDTQHSEYHDSQHAPRVDPSKSELPIAQQLHNKCGLDATFAFAALPPETDSHAFNNQSPRVYPPLTGSHLKAFSNQPRPVQSHRKGQIECVRKSSYCSLASDVTEPLDDHAFVSCYDSQSSFSARSDSGIMIIDSAIHTRSSTPEEERVWHRTGFNFASQPKSVDPIAISRGPTPTDAVAGEAGYVRTSAVKRRRPNENHDCQAKTAIGEQSCL